MRIPSRLVHTLVCVLGATTILGCRTVHTDAENPSTVGWWVFEVSPKEQQKVIDVLHDHGLHAAVDDKGVFDSPIGRKAGPGSLADR